VCEACFPPWMGKGAGLSVERSAGVSCAAEVLIFMIFPMLAEIKPAVNFV
jgi:hypothetical protein